MTPDDIAAGMMNISSAITLHLPRRIETGSATAATVSEWAEVVGPNNVARTCSALVQVATTAGTESEGGIRALGGPRVSIPVLSVLHIVAGTDRPRSNVAADFVAGARALLTSARSMLLTGAASAKTLLVVDVLQVAGEILSGMPCCRSGETVVISKSGGFCDADAFVRLADGVNQQEAKGHGTSGSIAWRQAQKPWRHGL